MEIGERVGVPVERLTLPEEMELIRKIIQFNDVLEESVRDLEPHRMVFYLLDLAGEFHRYYNRQRVISEDMDLSRARLLLIENVQKTVRRRRRTRKNGRAGGSGQLRTLHGKGMTLWRRIAEAKTSAST
jgi:glycyl-tRNA synthetase beta subunit